MENMDKELNVPKCVLIVWPKIPQMPQILFTQFVCPGPKVLDFNEEKASLGVRIVRGPCHVPIFKSQKRTSILVYDSLPEN